MKIFLNSTYLELIGHCKAASTTLFLLREARVRGGIGKTTPAIRTAHLTADLLYSSAKINKSTCAGERDSDTCNQ